MSEEILFFGYGSLIFAPELPERCLLRVPARLEGYRREFNKRSRARSCPIDQSFDAFPEISAPFRAGGVNFSLALGTVPAPGAAIEGMLLCYAPEDADEVMERTDVREGYDPGRPSTANGYIRESLEIVRGDTGSRVQAWTYLSNLDPECIYYVDPAMTLGDRARILVNATPRRGEGVGEHSEVRGLRYLEGVRRDLLEAGIVDPALEGIAEAVRALDGPWKEIISPAGTRLANEFAR